MTEEEWTPLWTEEERWRLAGNGDAWDAAERGDPIACLLRERIRAAEDQLAAQFFESPKDDLLTLRGGSFYGYELLTVKPSDG